MTSIFYPSFLCGEINSISSKSDAHRKLICAALSDNETFISCEYDFGKDIEATIECLRSLGAEILKSDSGVLVRPISKIRKISLLDCGESGSTFRFLLPVSLALGAESTFIRKGRLTSRPFSPLKSELIRNGGYISDTEPIKTNGAIRPGYYSIAGNISSQFISGLLMALSVLDGESTLNIETPLQSEDYVKMTLDTLKEFGAQIMEVDGINKYHIIGKRSLVSPRETKIQEDWSNAALWLSCGALGSLPISVKGLSFDTLQGDIRILSFLKQFGTKLEIGENKITVFPSQLHSVEADLRQNPDLAPILCSLASCAEGKSVFTGVERLRSKESDRITSICDTLKALGADIEGSDEKITVCGKAKLKGGRISSYNDHRIVMCAALLSSRCEAPIVTENSEAVNKSYPGLFSDFSALNGKVETVQ